MAEKMHLPKIVVDRGNIIVKKVYDKISLAGKSKDAMISACCFIACRQEGVSRTFKEICAASKVSKTKIGRMFRVIVNYLDVSVEIASPEEYISRCCSNLNLNQLSINYPQSNSSYSMPNVPSNVNSQASIC